MDLAIYLLEEAVMLNVVRKTVCGEVGGRGVHAL